jgi:hypothetical protein
MLATNRVKFWTLIAGDALTLILVTVFGFTTHGTLGSAGSRIVTTLAPLGLAWVMVAPFLGAYDLQRCADPRQLWRPFYAMVLAGPLAAWLRGVLLGNAPILPVFVVVLGGVSALSILAWRVIFWAVFMRRAALNG